MKNIILFVLFVLAIVFIQFASAQSVEDIIGHYLDARGGIDKLNSIQSIYFEGTREMMGSKVLIKVTKVNGKLSRTDFEFGGNHGYTIITPAKGWTYIPMRSDSADEIPAGVLKTMQSQMDIAGPLINYASKGYLATMKGKENINGKDAYKIQMNSATEKEVTYFIDTTTHLLIQTRQMSEANSTKGGASKEIITNFRDYIDVGGVMFPKTVITEGSGMGEGSITFEKIELNIPVDEKLYRP